MTFAAFNDSPDHKYKGHYHDYNSVIARGHMEVLGYADEPATWKRSYDLLYTCNNREIKPLSERAKVPVVYIGVIRCACEDVTAKSEFPLRRVGACPLRTSTRCLQTRPPFDLTDIVEAHKERQAELRAQGWERASVLTLAQRCTAWTRL